MAQSGDQNTSFGIYKNVCCGREIAISKGAIQPFAERLVCAIGVILEEEGFGWG
jgi:hypothetical protein